VAYIIIETDTEEGAWTLKERVTPEDMRSEFFCAHLVQRLRWAIADVDRPRLRAGGPAGPLSQPTGAYATSELS
jgi:hypothetical protein